jgi:hypothetical protein
MHRSERFVGRRFPFPPRLTGPAAVALALLAALPSAARAAAPVDLLSHRAAYRLSLVDSDGAAKLSQVRGGLVLEFRAACDGWLSQQRLGFVADAEEGNGFTYDVRFSSWESRDSTQLRFNVRSFDGRELQEEFRGLARLEAPGEKGAARYTMPEGEDVALPAGTIFPTEHVQELIRAARAGERLVTRQVFDGSGEDALTSATAVIGAVRTAKRPDGHKKERRWPVSLAYFPYGSEDALPQFELAFELAENGVLRDVTLDYGDFTLKAELEKLETFAPPACR